MSLPYCTRRRALFSFLRPLQYSRSLHGTSKCLNIAQKYLEKVQKRAEEQGASVDELKESARKTAAKPSLIPEAQKLYAQARRRVEQKSDGSSVKSWAQVERRDNLPVKPLADIMDIHRVLRTPHTAEQISALWTMFHASRSSGTGRGFLSATVPLLTYEALLKTARKYPNFIVPHMREASQSTTSDGGVAQPSYEFFFMQWGFHAAPPIPRPGPLDLPLPENLLPPAPDVPLATVLFTPLLEYKARTTFATPHLVLTLYPDLVRSHALVLLRGELTPSPGGGGRYFLSQQDAQLLALGMQRFYLADDAVTENGTKEKVEGYKERSRLLRLFNETPSEFEWESVLKHADPTS